MDGMNCRICILFKCLQCALTVMCVDYGAFMAMNSLICIVVVAAAVVIIIAVVIFAMLWFINDQMMVGVHDWTSSSHHMPLPSRAYKQIYILYSHHNFIGCLIQCLKVFEKSCIQQQQLCTKLKIPASQTHVIFGVVVVHVQR